MEHPATVMMEHTLPSLSAKRRNITVKGIRISTRAKPSIEKARRLLGWSPKIGLEESLKRTLHAFLDENEKP